MNTVLASILAIILAYLAGSVPFAIITSKLFGLKDPRTFGSGNPGATNVLRTGNKLAAALTLAGDAFKGWLAVYLAIKFAPELNLTVTGIALVTLAVFLGHLYSVFLKFKGGKGVATAIGILLAIQPWLAMATLATWIIIAAFFRYSSLAAIIAAIFAPFYYYAGDQIAWHKLSEIFWVICLISIMLIYKHKKNIANLLAGTETKLGQKNKHRH
ncbi:MAG: glycerol-3-phosphate 1-O-acyltransferase PlsY [Advenella sp.]|mgnify:CR=1 FL=1